MPVIPKKLISSLKPAQQLYAFLNELPSPFREQLLYRLYVFFGDVGRLCWCVSAFRTRRREL